MKNVVSKQIEIPLEAKACDSGWCCCCVPRKQSRENVSRKSFGCFIQTNY